MIINVCFLTIQNTDNIKEAKKYFVILDKIQGILAYWLYIRRREEALDLWDFV
jgi:hypothetical protein